MKRFSKIISVILTVVLVAAFASVCAFAESSPTPVSISVKTEPERTVYYEEIDTWDDMIFLDETGLVITVTNDDGTQFDVAADGIQVFLDLEEYVLGENTATVYYYTDSDDELTAPLTVTVEENPVESVKITKLPTKTVYDMDKDVLTEDNFSMEKLYESDPDSFDAMFEEMGITYDDFVAMYEDENMMDLFVQILFSEYSEILLVDIDGMEIEVTFKDGTTQKVTSDDDCAVYNGAEIPVAVGQKESTVTEGVNVMYVDVAGVRDEFEVTVNGSANVVDTPDEEKPVTEKPVAKPVDIKNPEIPNTDGGVSLAAVGVVALTSLLGIALVPSKKKEQF